MKLFGNVLTAKDGEVASILDAIVFQEQEFIRAVSSPSSINRALESPDVKEKELRTIAVILKLNKLLSPFDSDWPKECHFSKPFNKEMDQMMEGMTPEEFFNILVKNCRKTSSHQ